MPGAASVYEAINGLHVDGSGGRAKSRRAVPRIAISAPEDFRRISSIIDVDVVPASQRRVRLMKNGTDRPLGFYIRDGTSIHVTDSGLQRVPGIFISRLVPGGLADSTGLLAVNDEVLEVNGIEVAGKTLDQVDAAHIRPLDIAAIKLEQLLHNIPVYKLTFMLLSNGIFQVIGVI